MEPSRLISSQCRLPRDGSGQALSGHGYFGSHTMRNDRANFDITRLTIGCAKRLTRQASGTQTNRRNDGRRTLISKQGNRVACLERSA